MRKKAKEVFPKCATMTPAEREKEFREIRAGYDDALAAAGKDESLLGVFLLSLKNIAGYSFSVAHVAVYSKAILINFKRFIQIISLPHSKQL
jgi:hypothetical protein